MNTHSHLYSDALVTRNYLTAKPPSSDRWLEILWNDNSSVYEHLLNNI